MGRVSSRGFASGRVREVASVSGRVTSDFLFCPRMRLPAAARGPARGGPTRSDVTTGSAVILATPRAPRAAPPMSFLDEPEAPARRPGRRSGPATDRQTLMVRRAVAAGAGLLVLLLLIFGVKGCLDARKEQAFKDYVQDVDSLTRESGQESTQLFGLLQSKGGRNQAVNIENTLNDLRSQSDQVAERAKGLDPPGELSGAQRYLTETMELRRDGLAAIADALPTALGDQDRRAGTTKVALQMQVFLSSDILYSQRFVPRLADQLKNQDLLGQVRIPRSQFVPNVQWIDPGFVTDRVDAVRSGRGGGPAAPGLHGTGLGTVTLGGQALTSGGTATVKAAADLSFGVQVINQGENDETDVGVKVTLGNGGGAQELQGRIDSIAKGETKNVSIPVKKTPPTGQAVPVQIEVDAVPGEKKTDNNKQTTSVIFTG